MLYHVICHITCHVITHITYHFTCHVVWPFRVRQGSTEADLESSVAPPQAAKTLLPRHTRARLTTGRRPALCLASTAR